MGAATMSRPVPSRARGSARMPRQPGGRRREVRVKLSDAEYERFAAQAADEGVSLQRMLVEAAQAGGVQRARQVRRAVRELYSARHVLVAIGTNMNQMAARLNATGERDAAAMAAARDTVSRAAERLALAGEQMAAEISGGQRSR